MECGTDSEVGAMQTPSTGLRQLFSNHCLDCYATGLRKLSANEQHFVVVVVNVVVVAAQTAASL